MLAIDLIWIAHTPDIPPNASQAFTWTYVKEDIRFIFEARGLGTAFLEVLRVYQRSHMLVRCLSVQSCAYIMTGEMAD